MDFYIGDGVSSLWVDLDYTTKINGSKIETQNKSVNGKFSRTTWGSIKKWSLGMSYIPSSDAFQLNQWWADNTELTFVFDSSTYTAIITNAEVPFSQYNKPNHDLMFGTVIMERV